MPKLVNNVGKVFHKYSFIAHILNIVSVAGVTAMTPLMGHIPMYMFAIITATLSALGLIGSFIKQEADEYEEAVKEEELKEGEQHA